MGMKYVREATTSNYIMVTYGSFAAQDGANFQFSDDFTLAASPGDADLDPLGSYTGVYITP